MVFVTGATGLLGSHICFFLAKKGRKICALKQKKSSIKEFYNVFKELSKDNYSDLLNLINWVEGDLLDDFFLKKTIDKCTEVYHCAAYISFDDSKKNKILKTNFSATKNLVNFCIDSNIKKFCYISSIATLGHSIDNEEINEETPINLKVKRSYYAISKHLAEIEIFRANQEGLNTVVVNPGIIVGSNHWKRKSSSLFKNINFYTSGLSHLVDVKDVTNISLKLMEQNIFNEKFILVSNPISFKNQTEIICKILNKKSPKFINDFILKLFTFVAYFMNGFIKPLKELNFITYKSLTSKKIISNKKIKERLNYDFIPAEESLKKHSESYKKYINK